MGTFQGLELSLSLLNSDTVHLSFSFLIQGSLCKASLLQSKALGHNPPQVLAMPHNEGAPLRSPLNESPSTWTRAITAFSWLSAVNHFPLFQNPRTDPDFLEHLDQIQSISGDVYNLVHCINKSHHMRTSHIMAYVLYCSLYCSVLLLGTLC